MAARTLNIQRIRKVREFRLHGDPLNDFSDEELQTRYRFKKSSIEYITGLVQPDIERHTRRNHALPATLQVLVALRFYASGAFLQVIADSFGLDKSTVSRVITLVSEALARRQAEFIRWPITLEAKRKTRENFFEIAGFPCAIGCIDGTHIRIQAPSVDEPSFVNRKHYHSINVQAVCDARSLFINVVAKWPGATHDSHVFRMSQLCTYLEETHHTMDDGILLGDSGYALRPFLMTPYLNPTDCHQRKYNSSHKRTRCIIERTFGQWKRRFHVLHTEIRMTPEKACLIVGACAVLHNIAKQLGEPDVDDNTDAEEEQQDANYAGDLNDGRAIRNHISNVYF